MIEVNAAASYIYNRYRQDYGHEIDEMKLHKLLYFSQREAYILLGIPMFSERFAAWKYGPVLIGIRELYKRKALDTPLADNDFREYKDVFDSVFNTYAGISSWSLSILSHGEVSWQRARQQLSTSPATTALLNDRDIVEDANRIKNRRFFFNEVKPMLNADNR